MVSYNKRRAAVWGGIALTISGMVAASLTLRTAGSAQSGASPTRLHPTYVLRPLEECSGQRFLTEAEIYESARLIRDYTESLPTAPTPTGDDLLSSDDELRAYIDNVSSGVTMVLNPAQTFVDGDYPPEYYAAIDPDGDHCENPVPDELMMVDWSKLGPGSTTRSTTSASEGADLGT